MGHLNVCTNTRVHILKQLHVSYFFISRADGVNLLHPVTNEGKARMLGLMFLGHVI